VINAIQQPQIEDKLIDYRKLANSQREGLTLKHAKFGWAYKYNNPSQRQTQLKVMYVGKHIIFLDKCYIEKQECT
jgi:hypothetical protein